MRIDSHQHFWKYNAQRDQWITDEMAVLKRDFLPEHLIPELSANHIDGCVAVQADQSEEETSFLLQMADQCEAVKGVVGWIDLRADDVAQRLTSLSKNKKLRGFRHVVQAEPDDRFMLGNAFLRGVSFLKQFNFTYDILIYPRQLPAAIELAARFPNQPFVIDHIAKPAIKDGHRQPWARQMHEVAASPNVYCKISGLVTEASWRSWRGEDFKPYLDTVFEAFTPSRLMFGSDWPVCLLAGTYGQVFELIADYTRGLSAGDQEKIFGLNAQRFYRL